MNFHKIGKRRKGKEPRRTFDLIVFGATTDVGTRLSEYVARYIGPQSHLTSWAIADTNLLKLAKLHIYLEPFGQPSKEIGVYSIDPSLPTSEKQKQSGFQKEEPKKFIYTSNFEDMCKRTVIVVNCSPNPHDTELLIQCCIQHSVDYIDINTNMQYISTLYEKFHEKAKSAGVVILPGCTWSSISAEIGYKAAVEVIEGNENFDASTIKLTKVKNFINVSTPLKTTTKMAILNSMRRNIVPNDASSFVTSQNKYRGIFFYDDDISQWVVPCPSSDTFFIKKYLVENDQLEMAKSISHETYLANDSFFYIIGIYFVLLFVYLLSKISFFHTLICRWQMQKIDDRVDFKDQGQLVTQCFFDNLLSPFENQNNDNNNNNNNGEVGFDPHDINNFIVGDGGNDEKGKEIKSYSSLLVTANSMNQIALSACLLCLLLERMNIPCDGGCVTAATAFGKYLDIKLRTLGIDVTAAEMRSHYF